MCYKSPGPRCSAHALSRLKRAKASGNPTNIATAKRDFYLSPAGIRALRNAGLEAQADTAQLLRQELINLSKTATKLKAKETTPQVEAVPASTDDDLDEDFYDEDDDEIEDEDFDLEPEVWEEDNFMWEDEYLAADPDTQPNDLDDMAENGTLEVMLAVAGNPSTPAYSLKQLSYGDDEDIQVAVALNPSTPEEHKMWMADHHRKFAKARAALAQTEQSSQELLTRLANSDREIAPYVAANLSAGPELLTKLALDEDEDIRRAVASNPSATPEILTHLSDDEDSYIREAVSDNPSTHPKLLALLATDEHSVVRQGVAHNKNTPAHVLNHLAEDMDEAVIYEVAQNKSTPIETLLKMRDNGEPIHERQLPRIAAAVEEYRKKENLDSIPDSYIEKLLWGDTITK